MHRKLKKLNTTPELHARLAERKLETAHDLLSKHEYELMEMLDIPESLAQHLIQLTSELCCPPLVKASVLLNAKRRELLPFRTTLPALDDAMRGGLPIDSITEVVGPPGVGKTQLCHTMAVVALTSMDVSQPVLIPQGSVIYIDTETTFSAQRLVEIASARFPTAYSTKDQHKALASRVTVIHVHSVTELAERVDSLEELIIERHARLIVLDSIASVARLDFDATKTAARQDLLARIASMLKFAAERFHVPVLVSNQVTSAVRHTPVTLPHTPSVQHTSGVSSGGGGGGTFLTPALGVIWSHSINTRLALDFPPNALKLEHRRLTLAKSSMSPVLTMLYSIEKHGTQLQGDAVPVDGNYWGDTLSKRPGSTE